MLILIRLAICCLLEYIGGPRDSILSLSVIILGIQPSVVVHQPVAWPVESDDPKSPNGAGSNGPLYPVKRGNGTHNGEQSAETFSANCRFTI